MTDQSTTQSNSEQLSTKKQLECSRQTINLKKKNSRPVFEKNDSSTRRFSYQLSREMSKAKRKDPGEMCQLMFLKINLQQNKQRDKDLLHIYWGYQAIFNFIFKTS